jgi:cytochrome c-type biogenesis protein CcmH/NrfF
MIHAIAFLALSLTPTQWGQVKRLEHKLMAPCCYSQTIDEHMSQEAADMRAEVEQFVESGRSDREILTFYRKKYGETILASPDGITGAVFTAVPILLCSISILFLVWLVHAWSGRNRLALKAEVAALAMPQKEALVRKIRAEIGEF